MSEHKPISSYTVYDYGDGDEHLKYAARANDMHSVIWDLLQDVLRPICKHGQDDKQVEHYTKIREELSSLLMTHGVNDLF